MAPSTPPPPDTSNASATTTTKPIFQNPPRPPPPNPQLFYSSPSSRLPSNPNPNYPQLAPRPPHPQDPSHLPYPLASSGCGFISRPLAVPPGGPSPRPPFVFPYLDPGQTNLGFVRPNDLPHVLLGSGPGTSGNASAPGVMPGVVKGIPVSFSNHPKICPPSNSIPDNNGCKNLRDRNRDDNLTTVRHRKVRITDNASLYTLCRSWLRNGFHEETQQPQYLDTVKPLPRPLPVAAQVADSPDKAVEIKEEDKGKKSVEYLSEKELLQEHIKGAKRVRSRLREERLRRITRYKTRLALLLPPMLEQQITNGSADAN
ncbi:hypothetical protein OROGR_004003 [Orobanche gracilis]